MRVVPIGGVAACTGQGPFAVLTAAEDTGLCLAVETDGCRRFLDGDGRLRQLDAATIGRLPRP